MGKRWGKADFAELKALEQRIDKLEKTDFSVNRSFKWAAYMITAAHFPIFISRSFLDGQCRI